VDLFVFNAELAIGCGIGNDWYYDCFFVLDGAMMSWKDIKESFFQFKNIKKFAKGLKASLGVSVDFAFSIFGGGCLEGWGTDHSFSMRRNFLAPIPALLYANAIDLSLNLGFACPDAGFEGGLLGIAGQFAKGFGGSIMKNPIWFLIDMFVNQVMRLPEDKTEHACELCTISFAIGLAWAVPDVNSFFSLLPEYEMQYGWCKSFLGGAKKWGGEAEASIELPNTMLQEGLNLSEEECMEKRQNCPRGSFQSPDGSCVSCFSVVCERGTWARTCGECPHDKCLSYDCRRKNGLKNGQCMPQCWNRSEVGEDFVEESYHAYPDITWEECSERADMSGKDYFTYSGSVERGMCKVLKDGFEEGITEVSVDSSVLSEKYENVCEWKKFCRNGRIEVVLSSRETECGWNGNDALNQYSPGGNGHDLTECLAWCEQRGTLCQYAALSVTGYCHLFYTCSGDNGGSWQIYEKTCKMDAYGKFSIVSAELESKRYCLQGYIHIHNEKLCLEACRFMTTQPDTVFDSDEGGACESILGSGGNVCVAYWEGSRRRPTFIEMVDEEGFVQQAIHGLGPYGPDQRTSSFVCTKGGRWNVDVPCFAITQSQTWQQLMENNANGEITSIEQHSLCRYHDEWYYQYKPTCVAHDEGTGTPCKNEIYVCSNGNVFGTSEMEVELLRQAIDNGGTHPSCPRNPDAFCTGGVYDMRLTGKSRECDWDGVDSYMVDSPYGGGSGHSTTACIEACRNRGLQCNYAARSSGGYCHLFLTCKGQGSRARGWKVYEKYCKQNPGVMTIPAGDSRMTSPLVHNGVSHHDTLAISSGKKEWYFRSRSTCVAYGTPPEGLCDTSLYVCSATLGENNKGVYGSQEEQAIMLKVAVENGGVHPDCPRNPVCVKCNCEKWDEATSMYSNCYSRPCHGGYCVLCKSDGVTPVPGFWQTQQEVCGTPSDSCLSTSKITSCTASSEYSASFSCEKAYDGQTGAKGSGRDIGTAWATQGEGIGSWIELHFDQPTTINMMKYANRDAHTGSQESNRVVGLTFSDGTIAIVELVDPTSVADDWLTEYNFPSVTTTFVLITVVTVWGTAHNGAEEIAFFNSLCEKPYKCYTYADGQNDAWCKNHGHPLYYTGGANENYEGCGGCPCCFYTDPKSLGPFVISPSVGKCDDDLELTESECMAIDNDSFGSFKGVIDKPMPETCGCFLDEDGESRYFNKNTGACDNPDAGEQMICKENPQCVNRMRRSLSIRGAMFAGCKIRANVPDKVGPYHYDTCLGEKNRQPAVVEMFARPTCKYCLAAKKLLHEKGICYTWYDTTTKDGYLMLKHRVPDSKTVPEIFINGILYGGSDDLHRLEQNGQLNFLLSQSPRQAAAKPFVAFDSSNLKTASEYCESEPLKSSMSACMCSTCCHWDANVNRCWGSIHSDICYDTNCVAPVGINPNVVEPPRPEPIAPPPNNGGVEPFIDFEDQMEVWCPLNVPPCPHPCMQHRKRPMTCIFGDLEDLCSMATPPCQAPCLNHPLQPNRCFMPDLKKSDPSREGKPAIQPNVFSRILSKSTIWGLLVILAGLLLVLTIGCGIRKLCTRQTSHLRPVDLSTLDVDEEAFQD